MPKKNDPMSPPLLKKQYDNVLITQAEKLRKVEEQKRKASEKKAGQAMGKTETKLFKLAQQRESYHENVPKKEKKKQTIREYYQKNTIAIKQNPEAQSKFNAKQAADRKVSWYYEKWANRHIAYYCSEKDHVPASLKEKETKIFFHKATNKYFVKIPRLKHIGESISFKRQALGKMLDGTLQEITDNDMQQTVWKA